MIRKFAVADVTGPPNEALGAYVETNSVLEPGDGMAVVVRLQTHGEPALSRKAWNEFAGEVASLILEAENRQKIEHTNALVKKAERGTKEQKT